MKIIEERQRNRKKYKERIAIKNEQQEVNKRRGLKEWMTRGGRGRNKFK
jgi:hypothetical protein